MEQIGINRYQTYLKLLRDTWNNREDVHVYLGLLLTLTTISVFVWFAIRPTLATILGLVQHIKTQEQTLAVLEQKTKALAEAEVVWQKAENDVALINQALPDTAQAEITARQLETLAGRFGVQLNNLSAGKIAILGTTVEKPKTARQLPEGIQSFEMSLSVEGEPERVLDFLSALGTTRRPIIWDIVAVSGDPPVAATKLAVSINGFFPFFTKQ